MQVFSFQIFYRGFPKVFFNITYTISVVIGKCVRKEIILLNYLFNE